MRLACLLAACIAITVGLAGCLNKQTGAVDTGATALAVGIAAQLALAVDSGDHVQIQLALDNAATLVERYAGADPDARAALDAAEIALDAWATYRQSGAGDWRSALLALVNAINQYELEKLRAPPPDPVDPGPAEPPAG